MSHSLDPRELRNAFGTFATGITVITTKGRDGNDYGLTANSFSSVSLDPPLLLWCLGKQTDCYDAFQNAEYYAVHILADTQQDLSNTFASKGADKFAGLNVERGPGDIPMLSGAVTRFVCKSAHQYPGGDHIIHVGEVMAVSSAEGKPLLFHKGKYETLAE